jgi:hypothetical protein
LVRRLAGGLFDRSMLENDPAQNPDEPVPKFQLNAKVFQILGVLALALALPVTILILGLSGMRKDRQAVPMETGIEDSTAEVPGLRQSLESIAAANLPVGSVESSMRIFRLCMNGAESLKTKRLEVLDFLKRSGIGFVEISDSAQESWIVTIESSQAIGFEKNLTSIGFKNEKAGEGAHATISDAASSQSVLYRMQLEVAP